MADMVEVAKTAAMAGWITDPTELQTAVAVAWAESGGDPGHPGGVWGLAGAPLGLDAQAAHAWGEWHAHGWGAFPAHNSGRWLLYVPLAASAITSAAVVTGSTQAAGAVSDAVGGAAQGAADALSAAGEVALDALKEPLRIITWLEQPATWSRIARVVLGGILVVGGVYLLARVQVFEPVGAKVASVVKGSKPAPAPESAPKEET